MKFSTVITSLAAATVRGMRALRGGRGGRHAPPSTHHSIRAYHVRRYLRVRSARARRPGPAAAPPMLRGGVCY